MAASELSAWNGCCAQQLMVVLLGGRNSGKNFLGNLLLGKEEFVPKERMRCSRRLAFVARRWLTVVDTPGWWCDFSTQDTPELVKSEIRSSVSLCSPGPHIFLITVKASSAFSEKRRRAVEEHVSLLGEGVWGHCIIVFTSDDRCKHTVAEEHVQAGGETLRWLSAKCHQRCHSVNLTRDTEVAELLEKIHKLVVANGNRAFEMQEIVSQAAAEQRRDMEEKAQQRFQRMKQHRSLMQERMRPITNIRIVLLGAKGSGKSSALNTILSSEASQPLRRTARCVVGKGLVLGRQVTVVDTPGWWMNYFCEESSVFDRREMALSSCLCPPGPHAFLLVIRVDRAFTETYRRAAQEHLQLIGEHIWGRVMVLFSCGDQLGGIAPEQYIESEGEPLQWLVEKCGNRYHVLNNKRKGDGFQVRELIGKIEEMLAACNSSWHYEIERKVMEKLQRQMSREKERADERMMKKKRQRQRARAQLEKLNPLPEMRIVLVGGQTTGKSSCGNTILSRECFHAGTRTTSCTARQGHVSGRMVTVLDTPSCFPVTSELLTASCVTLLVVNVSSSFRGSHWEALEKQLESRGGHPWSRAAVLFSHGDRLGGTGVELHIESEGALLRRLVDKCGNRYHVLDNKHWGDGAQVVELIDLIEEMLAEERLAVLHRGDQLWRTVPSARAQQPEAVTLHGNDFKEIMTCKRQPSCDLAESAGSSSHLLSTCSEGPDAAGQAVAQPARRAGACMGHTLPDSDGFLSRVASLIFRRDGLRWAARVSLPIHTPPSQVCLYTPRRPTVLLNVPQTEDMTFVEESVITVRSLRHPSPGHQTLRRLSESGGQQALIAQWGESSLEELEAFIDSYFEVVRNQTTGFGCVTIDQDAVAEGAGKEEVLSSINSKLSKLQLLEEIREDLAKLRDGLECSWKAIQELSDRSKQDADYTS